MEKKKNWKKWGGIYRPGTDAGCTNRGSQYVIRPVRTKNQNDLRKSSKKGGGGGGGGGGERDNTNLASLLVQGQTCKGATLRSSPEKKQRKKRAVRVQAVQRECTEGGKESQAGRRCTSQA